MTISSFYVQKAKLKQLRGPRWVMTRITFGIRLPCLRWMKQSGRFITYKNTCDGSHLWYLLCLKVNGYCEQPQLCLCTTWLQYITEHYAEETLECYLNLMFIFHRMLKFVACHIIPRAYLCNDTEMHITLQALTFKTGGAETKECTQSF
jgi:hypothetical protein